MEAKQIEAVRVWPYFSRPNAALKAALTWNDEIPSIIRKCKALKHLHGLMPDEARHWRVIDDPLRHSQPRKFLRPTCTHFRHGRIIPRIFPNTFADREIKRPFAVRWNDKPKPTGPLFGVPLYLHIGERFDKTVI